MANHGKDVNPAIFSTTFLDDTFTSISSHLDHEPNLEFDDAEFQQVVAVSESYSSDLDFDELVSAQSADGTIEDNFEKELGILEPLDLYPCIDSPSQDANVLAVFPPGFIEVVGDDGCGRRIITISASRMPTTDQFSPDTLLRKLTLVLDKFVEQDYTLVYFHYGLNKERKPPIRWLWDAYKTFDRKYKKNLKALYLVHPTNWIRFIWQLMKPVISVKFGRKMNYVNYLHELNAYDMDLDQLRIPVEVQQYDALMLTKNPKAALAAIQRIPKGEEAVANTAEAIRAEPTLPTHEFGTSLRYIIQNNPEVVGSIPPVVRKCVEFLSTPDALETEGLFRRSASVATIKELQQAVNAGKPISFNNDPHNAAVLLKTFLKELEEPLLTHDLYNKICLFQTWTPQERPRMVKIMIMEELPPDNYKLLKYIMQFLWKVQDRSCINKMTASNLAIVFGPNLSRPANGRLGLQTIAPVNAFTHFLLENQETIFII